MEKFLDLGCGGGVILVVRSLSQVLFISNLGGDLSLAVLFLALNCLHSPLFPGFPQQTEFRAQQCARSGASYVGYVIAMRT